ncbi:CAP domain-containing protein [Bacillus ndiopicus]|uniref:CAP domain-containing protein n=1 Tax=Bacillus ndiopicus TaxID=1347368 RepID=UPI000694BF4B|nr:CAP-associated domain-containing protein [Bacillus ndiopicus]
MLKKWLAAIVVACSIFTISSVFTHVDAQATATKTASTQQKPYKKFYSEYDMMWEMEKKDYKEFYLVGRKNNEVVGGYDTRKGQTLFGIKIGDLSSTVTKKYGKPVESIIKGNTEYKQNYKDGNGKITSGTYLIDGKYVTFFYDIHAKNTIRSILWVTDKTEMSKQGFFTASSNDLRNSFEELSFHLMNQARVAKGVPALTYEAQYNFIGRQHSRDMIYYNFFDHKSKDGRQPWDRMKAGGIKFTTSGENLAFGQYSAIYAHEALMNSLGHRENILQAKFAHSFIGVQFSNQNIPYFTFGFYK